MVKLTGKRRDSSEIAAEMLAVALNGVSKTKIMYSCRLSFIQLKGKLALLEQKKLLAKTVVDGKNVYYTSEIGKQFLESFRETSALYDSNSCFQIISDRKILNL